MSDYIPREKIERFSLLTRFKHAILTDMAWTKPYEQQIFVGTSKGEVFVAGSQLLGMDAAKVGNGCAEIVGLRDKQVAKISKRSHVLLLTKAGQMFAWGSNQAGQIGDGSSSGDVIEPKFVNEGIEDVQTGLDFSMALQFDGKLYLWGGNQHGQIGNNSRQPQFTPLQLPFPEKIIQIACGGEHCFMIANHRVYGWGRNDQFQLGIMHNEDQLSPVGLKIAAERVCSVAATDTHSIFLTLDKSVLICGGRHRTPTMIEMTIAIEKIFSIQYTSSSYNGLFILEDDAQQCHVLGDPKEGYAIDKPLKTCLTLYDVIEKYSKIIYAPSLLHTRSQCPTAEHFDSLARRIIDSFDSPAYFDFQFIFPAEGKSIKVVRSLLSLGSEYLRTQMKDAWSQVDEVEIHSYSYWLYHQYIKFIYTGQLAWPDDIEQMIQLLDLSVCCLEPKMRQECLRMLDASLSLDNCCRLFEVAVTYELRRFEWKVSHLIADNIIEVVSSPGFEAISAESWKRFSIKYVDILKAKQTDAK